jgi:DNA-binding response OmpR family regulator
LVAEGHEVRDADEGAALAPAATHVATVLVVEDDDGNRLLVRRVLEEDGHAVVEATDGPTALRRLHDLPVDVVVLDLGLPGIDGLQVLAEIRHASAVPVLLLTARREETERVSGLDAGADDYMVKPYSVKELAARVRALLRRGQDAPVVERIVLGPVAIDRTTHRVHVDGHEVSLTPKEYTLLEFLVEQSPRTFSREALLHHVWGSMSDWQDDATVTEHVRRLRAKLGAAGCPADFIRTVRGFGYLAAID